MDDIASRRLRIVGGAVASVTAVGAVGALAWRNRRLIGELMGDGSRHAPGDDASTEAPPEAGERQQEQAGTAVLHHPEPAPATAPAGEAPSPAPVDAAVEAPSPDVGSPPPRGRRPFARRTEEGHVFTSLDPHGDLRRTCEAIPLASVRLAAGEITAGEMIALVKRVVDGGYAVVSESPPSGGGRRWRHVARDKLYEEVGRATLHVVTVPPAESDVLIVHRDGMGFAARRPEDVPKDTADAYVARAAVQVSGRPLVHGDVLVVYRDADGSHWARERGEFLDGRFEAVSEGPTRE